MNDPRRVPLTEDQEKILATLKAANQSHQLARRTKTNEIARRISEAKIEMQRKLEETEELIRINIANEIAQHASNADEALIAAYNAGITVRVIARDGFGNRHDTNVHALLRKLREDSRVGNVVGFQERSDGTTDRQIVYPEPVNMDQIILEATQIADPEVILHEEPFELLPPSSPGANDGVTVQAATIKLDHRDNYLASIRGNARKGSPYTAATTATIYIHPGSGQLVAHESREEGDLIWDHPIARFVKDHNDEVREEFDRQVEEAGGGFPTSTI